MNYLRKAATYVRIRSADHNTVPRRTSMLGSLNNFPETPWEDHLQV